MRLCRWQPRRPLLQAWISRGRCRHRSEISEMPWPLQELRFDYPWYRNRRLLTLIRVTTKYRYIAKLFQMENHNSRKAISSRQDSRKVHDPRVLQISPLEDLGRSSQVLSISLWTTVARLPLPSKALYTISAIEMKGPLPHAYLRPPCALQMSWQMHTGAPGGPSMASRSLRRLFVRSLRLARR